MIVHARTRLGDMFGLGELTPHVFVSQESDAWATKTAADFPTGQYSAGIRRIDIPDSVQLGRFAGGSSVRIQDDQPPAWAPAYGFRHTRPTQSRGGIVPTGMSGCCSGCVGGNHCEGGLGDIPWPFPGIPMWPALAVAGYLAYRVFTGTKRAVRSVRTGVRRRRRAGSAARAAYRRALQPEPAFDMPLL